MFNARSFLPIPSQTPWPRFGKKWSRLREKFVDDTRKKKKKKNRISVDYIYSYHGYMDTHGNYFPSDAAEVTADGGNGGFLSFLFFRVSVLAFSITIFNARSFTYRDTNAVAQV